MPSHTGRRYEPADESLDEGRNVYRLHRNAAYLRKDKKPPEEVFGTYIHTYKFQEAVADKVVLDLKYEARNSPATFDITGSH